MIDETEVLRRVERLSAERLTLFTAEAWVRPRSSDTGPAYDETDLARLRLIVELTEDLSVNDAAVPVILGLIDEVSTLRRRMRLVDAALDEVLGPEPSALRAGLLARLQALSDAP